MGLYSSWVKMLKIKEKLWCSSLIVLILSKNKAEVWWYVGGGFVHTDHFTSEVSEIYKIEKKYCKSNGV